MLIHDEIIDVVDENDTVIGQMSREEADQRKALHRVSDVWFYNTLGEVFCQKRSIHKKGGPGLLECTAAGHVAAGQTYEQGAVLETKEETGITVVPSDLQVVGYARQSKIGKAQHLRKIFAYKFMGTLEELIPEPFEVDEFQLWKIDDILNANAETRTLFVPHTFDTFFVEALQNVKALALRQS